MGAEARVRMGWGGPRHVSQVSKVNKVEARASVWQDLPTKFSGNLSLRRIGGYVAKYCGRTAKIRGHLMGG